MAILRSLAIFPYCQQFLLGTPEKCSDGLTCQRILHRENPLRKAGYQRERQGQRQITPKLDSSLHGRECLSARTSDKNRTLLLVFLFCILYNEKGVFCLWYYFAGWQKKSSPFSFKTIGQDCTNCIFLSSFYYSRLYLGVSREKQNIRQ